MANTMGRFHLRGVRAVLAPLLSCAAVACRAPSAASRAAPEASPSCVDTTANRPASNADPAPFVLLVPSGSAYLVLRSEPERLEDGLAWEVMVLAGEDPAEVGQPDVEAKLTSIARDALDAFSPFAEAAKVDSLAVTMLFGKPGGRAATDRRLFRRGAPGWHDDGAGVHRDVMQLPGIQAEVTRDPEEETSARDAAANFIADADRADYDSAWTKASARVKASMSRTDFERSLGAFPHADPVHDGKLYVSFPVPTERFLPGANMMAWISRATAKGPAVETLELRLDDDMEWRVAAVVELSTVAGASVMLENGRSLPVEAGSAE
jgi:hypothetical protein